jgi:hypothetical protein
MAHLGERPPAGIGFASTNGAVRGGSASFQLACFFVADQRARFI